jgi:hypothetical protein
MRLASRPFLSACFTGVPVRLALGVALGLIGGGLSGAVCGLLRDLPHGLSGTAGRWGLGAALAGAATGAIVGAGTALDQALGWDQAGPPTRRTCAAPSPEHTAVPLRKVSRR